LNFPSCFLRWNIITQLPAYLFYNCPAYIATPDSLLAVSHQQIGPAARQSLKLPAFAVDQSLWDFLDLHRTAKSIRFHLPLVLETPETQARAEIDFKGSYSLIQNDSASTKICSAPSPRRSQFALRNSWRKNLDCTIADDVQTDIYEVSRT
jgi:hypothetical protein